ncbi:MAG: hypothetical protein ILP19_02165, partial [Oscillospiraceae bacterium]|nr:hypothetical protein [Oscillospiraceae bacterium]
MKRLLSAAAALCIAATMIGSSAAAADMSDYVRMNENVSYAMTSAQYWINKTDDAGRVLRTPEEIAAINAQNPPTENVGDYNVSLYDMGDTIDGGFVRVIFDEISAPADPS